MDHLTHTQLGAGFMSNILFQMPLVDGGMFIGREREEERQDFRSDKLGL